jgi:phenylalanyl-tRNA synthetase beta chain
MQFPESWLREFCDPALSTAELAELLTMSGFEVEELRPVAPSFSGVVVAEIVEAAPHPSADRLRVCRVDAGALTPDGPLQMRGTQRPCRPESPAGNGRCAIASWR